MTGGAQTAAPEAAAQPATRRRRPGGRLLPLALFVVVYFGVLVFAPLRLADLLWPAYRPGTAALLGLIIGPLALRAAYEYAPSRATRRLSAVGMTWLGAAFLLAALLLPVELARQVLPIGEGTAGLLVALTWLALCAVALVNAQRLQVRSMSLVAPQLPRSLRVVQLSDVHVGSRDGAFLRRVVERTRALDADHVLITGDLVDFGGVGADELAALADLGAPVHFVIGNHERYVDCEDICERLRGHGVNVLRDRVCTTEDGLVLVGIDDAERRTRVAEGLASLGPLPEGFRVLLYHRPDGLEAAAEAGVNLMLAGHTHVGQIAPFGLLVRRVFPRISGLYRVDPTRLYVSPGTGTWGPVMRLGSRNEITCIDLLAEP